MSNLTNLALGFCAIRRTSYYAIYILIIHTARNGKENSPKTLFNARSQKTLNPYFDHCSSAAEDALLLKELFGIGQWKYIQKKILNKL